MNMCIHNLTAVVLGNQMQMLWSPFTTPQATDAVRPGLALILSRCLALSSSRRSPSHSQVLPDNLENRLGSQTANVQGYVYQSDDTLNYFAPPIAPSSSYWWNCP